MNTTTQTLKPETLAFHQNVCWHSQYLQAHEGFKRVHKYNGIQPKGLMLLGDYGCGKTFLCEQYENQHALPETDELSAVAIVRVDAPPEPNPTALVSDILDHLGDLDAYTGRPSQLRKRLVKLLERLQVSMLIIDEVHDFLPSSGLTSSSKVIKFLKWFMNNTKIPLVICGPLPSRALLAIDEQLKSRFQTVIELKAFTCTDEDERLDFADYLDVLFNQFPRKIHNTYQLLEKDAEGSIFLRDNINGLLRICLATDGVPRNINQLLSDAIERTEDGDVVSNAVFAQCWEQVMIDSTDDNAPNNPFVADMDYVKCQLRKRGLYAA